MVGAENFLEAGFAKLFSRGVGRFEDDAKTPGAEIEEIIIIAADHASLDAGAGIVKSLQRRHRLGKETRLHFAGDFHVAGDTAVRLHALRYFFGEMNIFERNARLAGDGIEQVFVLAGIRFFGEPWAEND